MTASILTNTSAMVALQTLRDTNTNLREINSQISTGKEVASAKDNASVFAISKVMESDVAGFQAVSDSLSLGRSTVAVASNAAGSIGELLNDIKGKVIAANEDNVDRQKLQDEIVSLRGQISSIVSSAQFNGLNLIDGSADGPGGFSVLSSLDRDSAGNVVVNNIQFDPTRTNLSTASGTDLTGGTNPATSLTDAGTVGVVDANNTGNNTYQVGSFDFLDAAGAGGGTVALAQDGVNLGAGTAQDALVEGDVLSITLGNASARVTVQAGDTTNDLVASLRQGLVDAGIDQNDFTLDTATNAGDLTITNNTEVDTDISFGITRASGGLAGLDTIDVSTAAGATSALSQIEGYIQNATDAQAQLGTTEKRLEIQDDFMSSLIDSFESGIGSLVDADLEEASARLQALQAQQQLGIQALSIANQQPQNLLALFR
jgi:flagellin